MKVIGLGSPEDVRVRFDACEVDGRRKARLIVRDAFCRSVHRIPPASRHPARDPVRSAQGLVAHGVLRREPDAERPGREIYELTDAGRALWSIVHGLNAWASLHVASGEPQRLFTHALCGQPLDQFGRCSCPTNPPPDQIVMSLRPGLAPVRSDPISVGLAEPRRLLIPLQVAAT